ncbi:DMT family transporter [Rhodobacteraceae bacterium LMO-12]|nr:DMT family transporter [Rhodobacteraceae bacterium LMO-JJ12]
MNTAIWLALPVVMAGGAAATIQAPINSVLGRALDNTLAAAAFSFGVGFLVLISLTLVTSGPGFLPRVANLSAWQLSGGAFGAFYVWSALWGVPILGVVTLVSAMVLGQMLVALLIDSFGPFGLQVRELSVQRIVAVVLVAAGLILSRF